MDLLERLCTGSPGNVARALTPGLGISFSYETRRNGPAIDDFTLQETHDVTTEYGTPGVRAILLNGTGNLRLTVTYSPFPEHDVVVIGAELENIGILPIPNIREIRPLDLRFDTGWLGAPIVHTIGGGVTHGFFPPIAFELQTRQFISTSKVRRPLRIDSGISGRSSDLYTPLFFIEDPGRTSGMFAGLEWSSSWNAEFYRHVSQGAGSAGGTADVPQGDTPATDYFYLQGTLEDVDYALRPHERLELPRGVIGFYEGSIDDGRNALRHFINDWFPKYQGGHTEPPVTFNTGGPLLTEERFCNLIPVCADLGFEWMQIDWGWFPGCRPPEDSYAGMGNWEEVDLQRFPNGIAPIADQVRAHGMKYCTWIDPEEAHPSSRIVREHPEWMIYSDRGNRYNQDMALVNFGLRDVQDYFIDLIGRLIQEWGIHKLKWDHNIDPRWHWLKHDDPERRGALQLEHIRGVWHVWDELRNNHPTLILENCSSGGRRFDLGAFSHAHIHHSSDFKYEDDIVRNQISGLNTVMPSYRVISTVTQRGPDAPDMSVMSRFGSILRFQEDFLSWSPEAKARVKRHIGIYKSVRHLLNADFYALFPQPRSQQDWDGWQFHDPDTGEGFVMSFRMQGDESTRSPKLRGLTEETCYRLHDPYSGNEIKVSGTSLQEQGITTTLDRNSANLWHYRPE